MLGQPIQMNHESAVIKNSKEAEGGGNKQTQIQTQTNTMSVIKKLEKEEVRRK